MGRHRNYGGSSAEAGPQEPDEMRTIRMIIPSLDLLALHTTPIPVVPAPGPGFAILPIATMVRLKGGTTPYSAGSALVWLWNANKLGTNVTAADEDAWSAILDSFQSNVCYTAGNVAGPNSDRYNKPLSLFNSGVPLTLGDADLELTICYAIVNISA